MKNRQFYEVTDWAAYQYTDRRKVPSPPWKWFRVQLALLRSPEWLALSAAQRADFIAVLGAASETGNLIPDDPSWLQVRGISRQSLRQLVGKSLVARVSLPSDHARIKELRRVLSGVAPDTEDRGQRAEDRGQISEGKGSANGNGAATSDQGPAPEETAPDRPRPCRDPRTFPEIKNLVRELCRAFPAHSPDELHKLGGRGKHLSLKQIASAYKQLREDGEFP